MFLAASDRKIPEFLVAIPNYSGTLGLNSKNPYFIQIVLLYICTTFYVLRKNLVLKATYMKARIKLTNKEFTVNYG